MATPAGKGGVIQLTDIRSLETSVHQTLPI
jgi:hypothetical protein